MDRQSLFESKYSIQLVSSIAGAELVGKFDRAANHRFCPAEQAGKYVQPVVSSVLVPAASLNGIQAYKRWFLARLCLRACWVEGWDGQIRMGALPTFKGFNGAEFQIPGTLEANIGFADISFPTGASKKSLNQAYRACLSHNMLCSRHSACIGYLYSC